LDAENNWRLELRVSVRAVDMWSFAICIIIKREDQAKHVNLMEGSGYLIV
jgi:hypothetical protein